MTRPSRPDLRSLILGLAAVAAAAFLLVYFGTRGPSSPNNETTVAIGGPFSLIDQDGKKRSDADFRGSLMLVYFGYTSCPDVCPLTLQNMSSALTALGDKGQSVVPLFITIDPERDSVAKMKEYAARFSPRLVALSGAPADIAAAAKAYRVYFAKHEESGGGYSMDHTSLIYLMDRDGHYLTHFSPDVNPQDMAAGIAKFL
ncbi:MAG: SCO family protein [Alphaproteobacteria bacterium]